MTTEPETGFTPAGRQHAAYWDQLADTYQSETRISIGDFHYGPMIPGDSELNLLPENLNGMTCLELACGAGQNSLFLAKKGATCTAVDISSRQLASGRSLAEQEGLSIDFHCGDIDTLSPEISGFDLIHSAYGIPFASNPDALIRSCAERLNPGGTLIFSMGHPVYAGEWLELDDTPGIFLQNYFHPVPDVREGHEEESAQARAFPVSTCVEWVVNSGMVITALLEPKALPSKQMTENERTRRIPYYSKEWAEQEDELMRFPIVLILRAVKP